MNKHNRLDILSGIAQDIIDSCTLHRAKLLAGKNKTAFFKKPFFKIAIAAVLCLAIGLPLLWMLLSSGKQVPVYQGMTLSSEPPAVVESSILPYRPVLLYNSLTPQYAVLAHKEQGLHDNRPGQKLTDKEGNPLSPEAGESIFYANQNEDFYITVHIDNPDNFEIVSFTLNGKKYSSYMFEDGSDMENLILKCNVGDASGIVEYTIDAIKYIDGTAIKDVRLDGDQTVRVGVYTDDQPTAVIGTPTISFSEISFDLSINDPTGILGLLDSEVSVVLYRENTAIDSQSVNFSEATTVRFTGLDDGVEYRVAVIANYDAFDGAGKTDHTIGERTVTTLTTVTLQVSEISHTEAVAKLKWHDSVSDKTAVSFALYADGEKVRDLNGNEVKLSDLLSGKEYTVKVEYTHDGKTCNREVTFITKAVDTPILNFIDLQSDLHSVSAKLKATDPLKLITVESIVLKQGDNVIATASESDFSFGNLEKMQTYTVEVTYSFELMNGNGKQTKTLSTIIATQSKGLKIENGVVVGIGTCTNETVYINMPIGDNAFENGTFTDVVLGEGCTSIGKYAFAYCSDLESIIIPEGIVTLKHATLYECHKLKQVILPESLTSMEDFVFAVCKNLKQIQLPSNLTSIGDFCFARSGIIEIELPEGISVLSCDMFDECKNLVKVKLPSTLKEIKYNAFNNCNQLESVNLPDGLTKIGASAFYGCKALQMIVIPLSVTKIDQSAFSNVGTCKIYTVHSSKPSAWNNTWVDKTNTVIWSIKEIITDSQGVTYALKNEGTAELVSYDGNTAKIVLGISGYKLIGTIPREMFMYNNNLVEIVIPEGITAIEFEAFYCCTQLQTITLPNSLKSIGAFAFHDCHITELIIPNSVDTIEALAFSDYYQADFTIYCEAPAKPIGWHDEWADESVSVIWGYTG